SRWKESIPSDWRLRVQPSATQGSRRDRQGPARQGATDRSTEHHFRDDDQRVVSGGEITYTGSPKGLRYNTRAAVRHDHVAQAFRPAWRAHEAHRRAARVPRSYRVNDRSYGARAGECADVRERRRADRLQQLRGVPSAGRSGADVAAVVRGRSAV